MDERTVRARDEHSKAGVRHERRLEGGGCNAVLGRKVEACESDAA